MPTSCSTSLPAELRIKFLPNGCCNVWLLLKRVAYLLLPDGELGEPAGPGYTKPDDVLLVATVDCAVEPERGQPRYRKITDSVPATKHRAFIPGTALNMLTGEVETFAEGQDWFGFLDAKPEAYLTQDRFFGIVCAREEITIWDLLTEYIDQADAAPSRFA